MLHSLELIDAPDAVPAARRFAARVLRGTEAEELTADVQVVLTELTTNAVIHAGLPVTLHLDDNDGAVRIEVVDSSPSLPVRVESRAEEMTGRGIPLVDAISDRWGVERRSGGKAVWAELGHPRAEAGVARAVQPSIGADRWIEAEFVDPSEPRYQVVLDDVPVELLVEAKSHVDNLIRELMLAAAGAANGGMPDVPEPLQRLLATLSTQFAEVRRAIKQQALAAMAAGEARTRLTLLLPLRAAQEGREYLAAMAEADDYARAARLLILETPPRHRSFRRWYVTALVSQLEQLAAGLEPARPPTFEEHLLGELETVTEAQRATDHAARLQSVTASLAAASSVADVATIVVSEGVAVLGASGGGLLIPQDGGLVVPASLGYTEPLLQQLRAERLDAPLPAAAAVRTGEPVWLESREERDRSFPALIGLEPGTVSMCAVPLKMHGRVLGALRFSFSTRRLFDNTERTFVLALALQTAQALDRVALHHAERIARASAETAAGQLARLHRITASLAAAKDANDIAEIVVAEAGGTLGAELSALCVLHDDGETLEVVGMRGVGEEALRRWARFSLAADLPVSEAVRSGRPVVCQDRRELEQRFPVLAGEVPREGPLFCVPFVVGEHRGALALGYPLGHLVDDDEIELLTTIGRQCGLALERAALFAAERAARERSTFVAEATGLLTSSLEPLDTLHHLTSLVVPALADWATVYLVDHAKRVTTTTVAHRDHAIGQAMQRLIHEHPTDLSAPGGIGDVLRTGRSICYARTPEHVRRRMSAWTSDPALARALVPKTAMVVPLVARERIVGAIELGRTAGRAYSDEDLLLVEDVAARAAVAIANAEQYGRERDAALTLQRSLLPQEIPHLPGVAFAWRYLPGAAGTHIGGDWYDVFPLVGGRVALVIGDVMGRGLRAAAVMGQLRATARAHADIDVEPADVLFRLDSALRRLEQDQITTVLFAVLDPVARTITAASAGHLPPLVTTGDGQDAYFLDVHPGPPLGTGAEAYQQVKTDLPPRAILLLYTDGLVEDRRLPVDAGLETLRDAARYATGPEDLCDRAMTALGRDVAHDDDTAMLAVALLDVDEGDLTEGDA